MLSSARATCGGVDVFLACWHIWLPRIPPINLASFPDLHSSSPQQYLPLFHLSVFPISSLLIISIFTAEWLNIFTSFPIAALYLCHCYFSYYHFLYFHITAPITYVFFFFIPIAGSLFTLNAKLWIVLIFSTTHYFKGSSVQHSSAHFAEGIIEISVITPFSQEYPHTFTREMRKTSFILICM